VKRIDFEHHYYAQPTIDVFMARTEPPCMDRKTLLLSCTKRSKSPTAVVYDKLLDLTEARAAEMTKHGVDMAVLSCSFGPEQVSLQEGLDITRKSNDAVADAINRTPGRYLGSAILPVQDPAAACNELERCVKEYGFVSWHTHSNYGESYADQDAYRPIFEKAADLGVYIYLHPATSTLERVDDLGFAFSGATLGFTLDTMITACRLIFLGVLDELPNLKVVLGHLGEALPFLLERMDNRFELLKSSRTSSLKNKYNPSHYFKNGQIKVTTSGNASRAAFLCTKEVLGIESILFGSDYPYEPFHDSLSFLDSVPLTVEEREKLFFRNAESLLGRSLD
jgi:hypothetical protein